MLNNQKQLLPQKTNLLRMIVIIGSVLLFAGGPDYYSPRSFKNIWDLGHILFFSVLSYLILISWSKNEKMTVFRQAFSVIFIALFLGTLIEIAQVGSRRTPDVLDIIRNVTGCLISLSFFAPSKKTFPNFFLKALRAITILVVTAAIFPAVKSITDEVVALRQFPVLSDFETRFETDRWSGNATLSIEDAVHFHGKSSMKVVLNTSIYSGTSLKYFPGNWLNYEHLHLSIFNPHNEPLEIICRIHDRRHTQGTNAYDDRFNKNYVLLKGWNQIVIPLEQIETAPKNRKLNLGKVQELGVFVHRLPYSRIIYIDHVGLSKSAGGSNSF